MNQRRALGRGLEALMSSEVMPIQKSESSPTNVSIDRIFPNSQQPRLHFDDASILELAQSIKQEGLLQPLIVRPLSEGRFELIAGERRLRAANLAGLKEVPVVIRDVGEDKMLELALIENIQREDLNPIEEAKAFSALEARFNLNQADIGEKVGKSREHVANALRLLKLPKIVQEDVILGKISAGHARALLGLPTIQDQLYFREKILGELLSVRDVERLIQERSGPREKMRRPSKISLSPQMKLLLDEMEKVLGVRVKLQVGAKEGQGHLVIDYYSWQDLDRIYRKITSQTPNVTALET